MEEELPSPEGQAPASPAPPRQPLSWGWGLVLGLLVCGGVAAWLQSQITDLQSRLSSSGASHKAQSGTLESELEKAKEEQNRLSSQLKKAFAANRVLLKERDDLKKKLQLFTDALGSASSAGITGRLPEFGPASVEPVTVRPLSSGPLGSPPLSDGSQTFLLQGGSLFTLNRAAPQGIKVSPLLASLTPPPQKGAFDLLSPVGIIVEPTRPSFTWKPPKKGLRFQVSVLDQEGKEITKSPWIEGDSWQPESPLPRGQVLTWKMAWSEGEGKEPKPRSEKDGAKFALASESDLAAIEKIRQEAPGSSLRLSLAFAEAGLLAEAEARLDLLERSNPGHPIPATIRTAIRRAAATAKG